MKYLVCFPLSMANPHCGKLDKGIFGGRLDLGIVVDVFGSCSVIIFISISSSSFIFFVISS